MAQESMQDIKRRSKSVGSTKQITKAMELVSTSKLKRAREKLEAVQPYYTTVLSSIQKILATSEGIKDPMLQPREIKNKCYIVYTADRGLAGGYNANILKQVEEAVENKENAKIIVIGQKGSSYFRRNGYDVVGTFTGVSESPSFMDATQISNMALKLFRDEEVDEVNIVYTKFNSTISHEPTVMKILPADELHNEGSEPVDTHVEREYEPSPEEVLAYLIPKYVKAVIYGTLIESSASEQGARRVAMESATDNAEELIEELDLRYNRARQAAITQEISEIVGGADALS